jgi:phospholipid/cholesterol/gamma-HCH transport system ATP-binding protein
MTDPPLIGPHASRARPEPARSSHRHVSGSLPRRDNVNADKPIIEVRGLSIGWGDTIIQRNLNFVVERGEVFGILGGSGSGKSTLLRFLVGLEEPIDGAIDVASHGLPDLEAGLPPFGVMFQAGALFGALTIGENVSLPMQEWTNLPDDAISAIARAKLKLVGLDGSADKFPSELSGGMKKRAAIARALALDPDLVFLDEPSAGLDPVMAANLDELIATLSRALGITVVIVTHELESIYRIVGRVVLLDQESKTIIATGTPQELRNSDDPRVSDFFNRRSKSS